MENRREIDKRREVEKRREMENRREMDKRRESSAVHTRRGTEEEGLKKSR